jgi:hypothetical protein
MPIASGHSRIARSSPACCIFHLPLVAKCWALRIGRNVFFVRVHAAGASSSLGSARLSCAIACVCTKSGQGWRIGFLVVSSRGSVKQTGLASAFVQGMREQGYAEGRNFVIEWQFAAGRYDALPKLVAELVELKVDASERSRRLWDEMTPPRRPCGFSASLTSAWWKMILEPCKLEASRREYDGLGEFPGRKRAEPDGADGSGCA